MGDEVSLDRVIEVLTAIKALAVEAREKRAETELGQHRNICHMSTSEVGSVQPHTVEVESQILSPTRAARPQTNSEVSR